MNKIKGLRWWMIALIMVGAIINYLTRSTLSVAAPTILKDLAIGEKEYSYITGAFQGTIMMQPIVGYVLDVIGLKTGFAMFAIAWSFINMAHAFAHSWPVFAMLRGMLGFAEGSANPAGMKAVAEWFPAKERGLAGGVYNLGASAGSMLAPLLVGWAILHYNWQTSFVITGSIGLVWVTFWWKLYHAPQQHPKLSDEERAYIAEGQEKRLGHGARPRVTEIAVQRNFWGIALPRFLADPTWGTLQLWLPLYLSTVRGFDLKQIALTAWLPFLAADIGCIFGGFLSAQLQKRGMTLINARRSTFTFGAIIMTPVALVGTVASPYVAVALLCIAGFAHQVLSVTVITMSSDLYKRSEVATVAGMAGTFGNLGILLFNLLIGGLVKTVGYAPFFVCLGIFDLIGAAILWTFVRDPHDQHS
jgi:ACS family hexuronate transporter-like MFS transporter